MTTAELCPLPWSLPMWLHVVIGLLAVCWFLAAYQLFVGDGVSGNLDFGDWKVRVTNINPVLLMLLGTIGVVALVTIFDGPRRHLSALIEGVEKNELTNPVTMDYVTSQTLGNLHRAMTADAQKTVRLYGDAQNVEVEGTRTGACYADLLAQLCVAYPSRLQCAPGAGAALLEVCAADMPTCPPPKP